MAMGNRPADRQEALFVPTASVLQIVPGQIRVSDAFRSSDIIELTLGSEGFAALARMLAATIPANPPALADGPSLYGSGAFYRSALDYHLFRTCNHWVSSLLRAAGVPSSAVPGTFSTTLMAELRWRAIANSGQ